MAGIDPRNIAKRTKSRARKRPATTPILDVTNPAVRDAIAEAAILEIRSNQKVTQAILEAGLKVDMGVPEKTEVKWIEDRLGPFPEPMSAPLWERDYGEPNVAAMEPRRGPTLTVSHQVADVLNIGIDRMVDITEAREEELRLTQRTLQRYRRHHERVTRFLERASVALVPPITVRPDLPEVDLRALVDAMNQAIATVRMAIADVLEEGQP